MTPGSPPQANEKALARRVKDHVVGRRHEFFAVVHPGFEETSRRELQDLGLPGAEVQGTGGVGFSARLEDAWRVNLAAGTVSRLLMRLARFRATGFGEFRDRLAAIPWELHLGHRAAVGLEIRSGRSRLWHEGKLEEEAGRAIATRLAAFGREAALGEKGGPAPGQTVFLRLDENRCQVSLDTSGELLHRRGLGKLTEDAPLRETLACAVLRVADLGRYSEVIDPFCGSGTFALEAGAIFAGRPVNAGRTFAFQEWPSFREARFRHLRSELESELARKAPAGPRAIRCSDIDAKAAATAQFNLDRAGLAPLARVERADFFRLRPPGGDPARTLLVMNPPYGVRLEPGTDVAALYRRIGDKVRRDFRGCGCAVIVPGLELEKALGLPHDEKILFRNGGIPVALLVKHSVTRDEQ